jgi:hypothetical protein
MQFGCSSGSSYSIEGSAVAPGVDLLDLVEVLIGGD